MQIYAFVGKTGTGKSFNAQKLALQKSIDYIIDDAILIKNSKVIAGRSAKTEASKIASVKAAIFLDEKRKKEMISVIKQEKPEKLLILGTSDDMIERILENLGLGSIYETIYIDQIATKEQIEEARRSRIEEGKHVVPVPTFEIKNQFSGYFLDTLKSFGIKTKSDMSGNDFEKTIIRPTFSYLGNYVISDVALKSIISYTVSKVDGITKIFKVNTLKYIDGMKIDIDVELKYGVSIPSICSKLRNAIIFSVDNMTGINLFGININVKSIKKVEK